jgi:hypothetical protein
MVRSLIMDKKITRPFVPIALMMLLCTIRASKGLEVPLDFHGGGFVGKYLNSDTARYNMDASVNVYCTILRHRSFTFFVDYRDDLDMAEQTGGVSLDPRYAHYYITGGFDCAFTSVFTALYFVHDCVHDIDYDVEGTPVFNRFRLQCADINGHPGNRYRGSDCFSWNVEIGFYPHWQYHGWDINAGADYEYEGIASITWECFRYAQIGVAVQPRVHVTKGDSTWYHQHTAGLQAYLTTHGRRIGTELTYNLWNNDPIKDPDRLWLLSLFAAF